jgi:hypothetical protein
LSFRTKPSAAQGPRTEHAFEAAVESTIALKDITL